MDRSAANCQTRRRFVQVAGMIGLALVAGCGGQPFQAQPAPRVYRLAYLSPASVAIDERRFEGLQRGLRALGWIEGQNLIIERRLGEGRFERLPNLAAELVQLQPDVIVTSGDSGVRAVQQATSTIPIVFASH